jgi:3-methylfumaryl-CoA hydratase
LSDWQAWIGRSETREDVVDPGLVERFLATLDAAPAADGVAPQGLHWCLCPPDAPTARLGPDGHPVRDDRGLLPPIPLPRRMWAASKVAFLAPLRIGERVRRTSRLVSVTEKQGGSGPLAFAAVEHVIAGAEEAIRELQTIVYRDAASAGAPPSPPVRGEARFDGGDVHARRMIRPEPPLLFRYSALTFNSHRIHYDLPYACEQEGYRGLVVHGPLTATLLLDLARHELGEQALASFAFRGISPAVAGEPLHLTLATEGEAVTLGAWAADGTAVMSATGTRGAGAIHSETIAKPAQAR